MCGRYYLNLDNLLAENIDSNNTISYETNFNITPQTKVPVLIENKLTMATWGFFPDWIKSQKNSKPLFNTPLNPTSTVCVSSSYDEPLYTPGKIFWNLTSIIAE